MNHEREEPRRKLETQLHFVLSPGERKCMEEAAALEQRSLQNFMRHHALLYAEKVLGEKKPRSRARTKQP